MLATYCLLQFTNAFNTQMLRFFLTKLHECEYFYYSTGPCEFDQARFQVSGLAHGLLEHPGMLLGHSFWFGFIGK